MMIIIIHHYRYDDKDHDNHLQRCLREYVQIEVNVALDTPTLL